MAYEDFTGELDAPGGGYVEFTGELDTPAAKSSGGVGEFVADLGKRAAGAVVSGLASIPEAVQSGVRSAVRSGASADPSTVMPGGAFIPGVDTDESITGLSSQIERDRQDLNAERMAAGVRLPGARALARAGRSAQEAINETASQATKDAVANSQVTGNLLKGEIDFGQDPSMRGFVMQGADVFGSMLPVIAAALITRSPGAASAVGGAMAGGEGVESAREFIAKQSDEQLLAHSPLYKRMVDAGASPAEARQIVSARAEDASALLQGAVAAAGDRFTGRLVTGGLDPAIRKVAGKSILARTATGAGVSSLEQGAQELAEGVVSDIGTASVAGNKEIGEDSAANFVLGAIGGSAPGAGRGAFSAVQDRRAGRGAPDDADGRPLPAEPADVSPQPLAAPEGDAHTEVVPGVAGDEATNAAPALADQAPQAMDSVAPADPQDALLGRALDAAGIEREALQPAQSAAQEVATRLAELEVVDSTTGLTPEQQAERERLAERMQELAAQEAELEEVGQALVEQQEGVDAGSEGAEGVEGGATAAAESEAAQAPAAARGDAAAHATAVPVAGSADLQTAGVAFDPRQVQARTWPQFVAERGERIAALRRGTPAWDRLQGEWAAVKTARAGTNPEGTGATGAPAPEIQNRDRSRPASVVQMQAMAADPDYMRLGVSRSPETGAPMVFAVGDQAHAVRALGRADTAVMSDGQRVPFRYAVMEAADVQPSNFADGGVNPLFDAEHPGTVKALNNGRTAGLRAAYERGTAGRYRQELVEDAAQHGIDPGVIASMQAPMLVRLYSEGDNRANMGAKSQSQALGLSATEQAATDAALMDAGVLEAFEAGGLDSAANRDFARAFVGRLQGQGQDVGGMLDAQGQLSPAGVTRLQAALVHKAYGDGDLVESLFGSTDNDIRAIGEALKEVAGEWANMRHAAGAGAINPQVDVTGNLLQAIRMVQKARRERASLYEAVNQVDMVTGDVADPLTVGMLRMLYSGQYLTRAVGRERLAESLREYMGAALATHADGDMFGEQVGPAAILAALSGQPNSQVQDAADATGQPDPAQGAGRTPGGDAAGGRADEPGGQARRPRPGEAGAVADEAGRGGEGQDAQDSKRQPDRQGAEGAAEDSSVAVEEGGFALEAPTREEVLARQEGEERAQTQREQEGREQERRAQADAERDSFTLTGSDRPADVLEAQGQQPMFSRRAPAAPAQGEAAQQFKDTERAYGGRAAYDRAKAAGRTKLTYGQWVQVRTPSFKSWFGDWQALAAQQRLDAMEPVRVRVPEEWRGLPADQLRERVEASLLELMESGTPLRHAEIGDVQVVRKGVKKALSSSADPAKLQVLGDLRNAFEGSFLAGTQAARGEAANVLAYDKLLARLDVGGEQVVAVFTVRRLTDGSQFYNTVTLENGQKKTPVASPRDTPIAGERATSANTGVSDFVRRPLARVNPAEVSRVVDPDTGEPLVVYHGTTADFDAFDNAKTGANDRGLWGRGHYFSASVDSANSYALRQGDGARLIPAYVAIQAPLILKTGSDRVTRLPDGTNARELIGPNLDGAKIKQMALDGGHDGVIQLLPNGLVGDLVAYSPEQIKSATGNNGQFDPKNRDIRFSRRGTNRPVTTEQDVVGSENSGRPADDASQGAIDEDTGLPLNADGTVTVYHHTSAPAAAAIRRTGMLKADAEPDVYVTTRRETDTGYGDTAVAIRVDPSRLQIDDEFPDGRKDFRLSVGRPGGSIRVSVLSEASAPEGVGAVQRSRGGAANPAQSLADVRARLDALGVEHTLSESRGVLTVGKVVVPEGRRERGAGTAAMQAIVDYADAAGLHVALSPSGDFGGSKARLTQFYKRFGFKENKGRAKVYEVSETMVRENPQGRTLFSFAGQQAATAGFDFDAMRRAVLSEKPRDSEAAKRQAVSRVQQIVDAIGGAWRNGPRVNVVFDMGDAAIPQAVRDADATQKSRGAQGEPEGVYHGGQVYLLASQLPTARDAVRVLFHEALGHHGLRGVFGDRLDGILDQLVTTRPKEVRAKMADYGLPDTRTGRRTAAEEVLAEMAQARPELGFVRRTVAAVRNWLREHVPGFAAMRMTDADIIQGFILPARGWVERGRQAGSVKALDNAFPQSKSIEYRDGNFYSTKTGRVIPRGRLADRSAGGVAGAISEVRKADGGMARTGQAGWRTVARAALFRHLQSSLGAGAQPGRGELLDRAGAQLAGLERGRAAGERDGAPFNQDQRIFYSRGPAGGVGPGGQAPAPFRDKLSRLQEKVAEFTGYRSVDDALYAWQDKFIDLKRIQARIKALNGVVSETNDAYRGEELYHKRVAARVAKFNRDEVAPLVRAMRAADVGKEELERFLHARHAPEANRVMAERNPSQATIDAERANANKRVNNLRLQLQRAQARGTASVPVQKALAQALADKDRWDSAEAFRGTEEERLSLSGMSDAQAQAIMDALTPERRAQLDALAARVDRINEGTLKTLEDYGLMDRAALASWRKTYQHYVPLHRDEAHEGSRAHPIGQGFSTKGDASKRRTGSNERVTNILAHVLMQREAALTRGEKNNVVKRLYLLAAQNPDPELWSLDAPKKKAVDPDTGLVRTMVDQAALLRDNVVRVRIGGKDKFIVFNERNDKAVRLAMAMKNLDARELDRFTRVMGKLTRWFSAVNTQYNPVFGVVNVTRDTQAMMLQLSNTPLAGKQGQVLKNVRANLFEIYGDLRAQRKGAAPGQGQWSRLWEQMQLDGGTTGYRDLYLTPEDRVKALDKELAKLDQGNARAAVEGIMGWLSDFNEALENTTRLAVYKAALDQGLSRQEAASIAKNITVNFNRKGRNTALMGSWFAFFNAAIQGTARMAETLAGPAGRKVMIGGVTLGMMSTMAGMAMMGGGGADDEWKKIPEFVKERSLIIPLGRQDYVTIPMPLGFHVFPNIGRKMVEFATHDDPVKSRAGYLADLAMIMIDAFSPVGGADNLMQMFTPTPFDPAVAVVMNKDWTGRNIWREKRSDSDPTPGHARAKDSAGWLSGRVSRGINWATGGNEWREGAWSPTPDALEYLFGQITGGVGRELVKVGNMVAAATTGEELAPHQIVLAGRFYGNTRGANGQSQAYYENVKRINGDMAEAKGRVEAGEAADSVLHDVPLAPLEGAAKQVNARISELRKLRRQVQEQGGDDKVAQVKAINDEIEQRMYLLNQAVEDALARRREAVR